MFVEMNPTTSSGALVRERLSWHEIVRGLHSDAHVDLVRTIGELDLLPELRVLGVILAWATGVEGLVMSWIHGQLLSLRKGK